MSGEIQLNDGDVVSMKVEQNFAKTTTSKISEIKQGMIKQCFGDTFSPWIKSGVTGEVLLENSGRWQKGKIRLCFEFIPDVPTQTQSLISSEPKSPLDDLVNDLDDLRSQLNPE